ncbi:MAG: hypothetical protein QXI16_07165, partial [Sulfolobaceae archaeon]
MFKNLLKNNSKKEEVMVDTMKKVDIPESISKVKIAPFYYDNKILAAAPHVNKTFIATCQLENLLDSITFENFTKEVSDRLSNELLGEISTYFQNDHLPKDEIGIYISNIYLAFNEYMIALKAAFLGIDYTRYLDTLCFSTNDEDSSKLKLMLNLAKNELKKLSLTITPSNPEIIGNDKTQT